MEILFIWILEYKNFKEQGFNFSPEYTFNVKKVGKVKYTLTVSKNQNFIPNFFEKSNILNVTAIVGQNGSGKSNILEFIKTSFPKGYSSIQAPAIVAYRQIDGIGNDIMLIPYEEFEVEIIQDNTKFEVLQYPFYMSPYGKGPFGQDYTNADYIYYSNIFDLRVEETNMAGMHNLSTLAFLKSDTNEYRTEELENTGGNYDSFKANEIRRNIQFILSDHKKLLRNFRLPEYLYIDVLDNDLKLLQKTQHKDIEEILTYFSIEQSSIKSNQEEQFLNQLYISVFLNFLTTDREFSSIGGFTRNILLPKEETIKNYIRNFFKKLPEIKYRESIPIHAHEKTSKVAIEFFDFIEKLLEKKSFTIEKTGNINRSTIRYTLKGEALEELTSFLNLYINLKGITDFLNFTWRNLSSGEQSFFSFISRFYHLKYHQIQHEDLNKNLVILIDEGDIYFHPAWQKMFFKHTIDYLSELLKDHNLQFIFTANSPFITSDLPKSNIIFIEKKSKTNIIVHGQENDREETFGGNIHTLFADSFYMEGALIGEFAKYKINRIINYLQQEGKEKREDYKRTIDIIGEPLLKRKLLDMWYSRFGVEEEIQDLEKRIEELKRK